MATDEEIFREAMREFQDYDDESEDAQEKFYEYCMQKAREDSEKRIAELEMWLKVCEKAFPEGHSLKKQLQNIIKKKEVDD